VTCGARTLINNVNFSAQPGKLTVILGPNGAGKSTLLKVLSDDLRQDAGHVHLLGKAQESWKKKDIAKYRAVLPQTCTLNFGFQVRDVVRLGRLPFGQSTKDNALVREALSSVGLKDMEKRLYPELSGGEQRRVQFARILVQIQDAALAGSGILLLDEPTSNLDPAHAFSSLQHAHSLAQSGLTVVAIVHDINLAMPFADDIFAMKNGKVLFSGSRDKILTPQNLTELYDIETAIIPHPSLDCPMVAFMPTP